MFLQMDSSHLIVLMETESGIIFRLLIHKAFKKVNPICISNVFALVFTYELILWHQ